MVNKSLDRDQRTIQEFGNTYLGIPDTRAQNSRFSAPSVQFPISPELN